MDYLKGADLRYHICYKMKFSENEASKKLSYYRVHNRLHHHRTWVHSLLQHYSPRYKARKHRFWIKWVLPNHRLWNSKNQSWWVISAERNVWDSRIHGSVNYLQRRVQFFFRFLRIRSHCPWTHAQQKALLRAKSKGNSLKHSIIPGSGLQIVDAPRMEHLSS